MNEVKLAGLHLSLLPPNQPATLEDAIAYYARVSNPTSQINNLRGYQLVQYLIRNKHWSPFEMCNVTLEVTTSRDIARQLLRHKTFYFQEFSQRYSATETIVGTRSSLRGIVLQKQ